MQISLENRVARLVVTDLISGDSAKEQIAILAKEADLLMEKISVKDNIITKKDKIIFNYEEIIGVKDEQIKTAQELSRRLQTDLKKQKAKTKLFKLGTGGMILVVGALTLL